MIQIQIIRKQIQITLKKSQKLQKNKSLWASVVPILAELGKRSSFWLIGDLTDDGEAAPMMLGRCGGPA
jgi:hypothetical protein